MATFVSIIRELGFRGCLFFAVVMAFGYWTVTGWMTGGWMTGLGYMVAGGAVGATVVSGRIDGPVHMALGCISFFLTLAAFSGFLEQGVERGKVSAEALGQLSADCGVGLGRKCEETAHRVMCSQLGSLESFARAAATAQVGLYSPKEVSPFLDDQAQRDVGRNFPSCPPIR